MTAPGAVEPVAAPRAEEAPAPSPVSGRVRLALLAALLLLWFAPWGKALDASGHAVVQNGAARTGATAALALVALWGLAATAHLAATRRGMRIGAAVTDAAVALAATAFLLFLHPWLPGGALREAWVPVFGPLAALAALDAVVLATRADAGPEVPVIRAGASLFACTCFVVAEAWIPAAATLWLGLLPLVLLYEKRASGVRTILEIAFLAASAAAYAAPLVQERVATGVQALSDPSPWPLLWSVLTAVAALTAILALARGRRDATLPPA